jgi:hypothetical protein
MIGGKWLHTVKKQVQRVKTLASVPIRSNATSSFYFGRHLLWSVQLQAYESKDIFWGRTVTTRNLLSRYPAFKDLPAYKIIFY